MNNILVAGATGNLGNRICRELVGRGANVTAIVRPSTDAGKLDALKELGVQVVEADLASKEAITAACAGIDCVVSALAGLREVIIDIQKNILDGAIAAGVQRFIPSDFCTDYTALLPGMNRNFDLRREFREYLDSTVIKSSSVFNGAFADILQYNTPVLNLKDKSVGYWGEKAGWKLDFTTMDNTAAFTAEVALDADAPRDLQIASFQVSPDDIQELVKKATDQTFSLQRLSGLEDFALYLKKQRAENPAGENELYARWQQGQYMYSMFTTHHDKLANDRYDSVQWTGALEFIKTVV
ncbi:MAG: NAD-dependent epimerase/dehydratase family protein [Chitinophagaceae bacterium]|nr:MAG: NAD-dependent epimerase/dehydratase family protein [Chitinophagaceae bacterium]